MTRRLKLGTFRNRIHLGAVDRPPYAYCVYQAAMLAKQLAYADISVIEFGVAGGNGLLALETYAVEVGRELGINIEVYGFDTADGLPASSDYRDLLYHWKSGFFGMNEEHLRDSLRHATIIKGDVRQTVPSFVDTHRPAPIAAVMHDLDYYSSTAAGLQLFDVDERYRLPRIFCYFDDIIGSEIELYNDFTGERLAIREFNHERTTKKLSSAYHLIARRYVEPWYHQIFVLHDFEHSHYNDFVGQNDQQLPLR